MEIRLFFRTIQRGWWLILISVLIAINLSFINSYYLTTPRYEAQARLIISPDIQNFSEGKDLANSLETLDKRSILGTYAEIVSSRQVFVNTLELFNLDPLEFADYEVSVVVLPEASVLQMSVTGPNPQITASLANSIGQYAIDFINNLYQVYDISFLDQAPVPTIPYQPRPLQDALLAAVIGLAVGVTLAILRDQLSSSFESLVQRRMTDGESLAYARAYFERRMREELTNQPATVMSLGILYLSGLQEIYDSLPQTYINQLMRKVTFTLQNHLRGNDIIGRWSRLQFNVLLIGTPGAPAKDTLARIQAILEQPVMLGGEYEVCLDPRIGIASRQSDEQSVDFLEQAEQALETALHSADKVYLHNEN